MITLFSNVLSKHREEYSSLEISYCFVSLQNTLALKNSACPFNHSCMFPCFYLGTVYRNVRSSLYNKTESAVQTDSFDLTKIKKVSSNVIQTESREESKITRVLTSAPYISNTQINSFGTE